MGNKVVTARDTFVCNDKVQKQPEKIQFETVDELIGLSVALCKHKGIGHRLLGRLLHEINFIAELFVMQKKA